MFSINEHIVLSSLQEDENEEYVRILSDNVLFIKCPNIGRSGRLAVCRYDVSKRILIDEEHFSSQEVVENMLEELHPSIRIQMRIVKDWLLYSNTERKKAIKLTLMKSMDQIFLKKFHQGVERYVKEIMQEISKSPEIDIVKELAVPIVLISICEFMQIPFSDRDVLKRTTSDILLLAEPSLTQEIQKQLFTVWTSSFDYFRAVIKEKRKKPDTGFISTLMKIQIDNKNLEEDEIVNQTISLLLGSMTTINLICNATKHLLVGGYGAIDNFATFNSKMFLEEVLRYDPPSKLTARVAIKNCRIQGKLIESGQQVLILFGPSNRDSNIFKEPHRFNPFRVINPYLSLGAGEHFCLGANIAKGQTKIFLDYFTQLLKSKKFLIKEIKYKKSIVFRAMSSLIISEF